MPFDPSTAKPIGIVSPANSGVFDPTTAKPIAPAPETSQALGAEQILGHAFGNLYAGVKSGIDAIGGDGTSRNLELALGIPANSREGFERGIAARAIKENVTPGGLGRFAGETAVALPAMMTLGPLAGGMISGALESDAKTPLGAAKDTALGGAGGYVGGKIVDGISAVVAPKISKAVQTLRLAGIPLTIGQTLGGIVQSAEDKASSLPFVGGAIKAAQRRSIEGANRVAMNRALAPVGETLPNSVATGRDAIDYVATTLGDKYDALLPKMKGVADPQFVSDMKGIISDAGQNLPEPQFNQFQKVVKNQIGGKANGYVFDGDTLKGVESELGRLERGYRGDSSFDNQVLGDHIGDVRDVFRDMIMRNNPEHAQELSDINKGYAIYSRLRRAASSVGSPDGVFSPAQLSNAVKAGDSSAGKGAYARGNALLQDLSDPMRQVLPQSIPNSGTADRMGSLLHPDQLLKALTIAPLYSRPGQAALRMAVTGAPKTRQAIAKQVQMLRLPAGVVGAALAPTIPLPTLFSGR